MKRTTIKLEFWINHIKLSIITFLFIITIKNMENAIIPPPWSNPNINPCANLPGGWQLIYWKPLNKCFKIFTMGFPCPVTKELVPLENTLKLMETNGLTAICKCPPGTAELRDDCYKLFEKGPCPDGQYLAPFEDVKEKKKIANKTLGVCKDIKICPDGMVFWAQEEKCYYIYTKGPCPKGKLLVNRMGFAKCQCDNKNELSYYYHKNHKLCYEHFTRGPCTINGHIYLPGDKCGCKPHLPHYQYDSGQCYELETRGPCPFGNIYTISKYDKSIFKNGKCICKKDYVRWSDNNCYRLYTKGPCNFKEFIVNSTTCITNNCLKGQLYYPKENKCYHIGSSAPCKNQEVFIFDFRVRPSIDGLSYNGICGCSGIIKNLDQKCTNKIDNKKDNNTDCYLDGIGKINGQCYQLFSRGPCYENQWVEPSQNMVNDAKCKCHPRSEYENNCKLKTRTQFASKFAMDALYNSTTTVQYEIVGNIRYAATTQNVPVYTMNYHKHDDILYAPLLMDTNTPSPKH